MPPLIIGYFAVFAAFAVSDVYDQMKKPTRAYRAPLSLAQSLLIGILALRYWTGPAPEGQNWALVTLLVVCIGCDATSILPMARKAQAESEKLPEHKRADFKMSVLMILLLAWGPAYLFAFKYALGRHIVHRSSTHGSGAHRVTLAPDS